MSLKKKKKKLLCTFTLFYYPDYQLKIFVAEAALTPERQGDEESGAVPRRADLEAWKAGER